MTVVRTVDHHGRVFDRFHARRDGVRPGWFVFGRNPEYGDGLVACCAWRGEATRGRARCLGWRTRREAQVVADAMNAATARDAA